MNPWQATLKFPSIYNPVRKSFFHSKCNILGNDQYGFNTFNKVSSPFPRTTSTQLFSFSLLCTFFRQFYSFSFIFFFISFKRYSSFYCNTLPLTKLWTFVHWSTNAIFQSQTATGRVLDQLSCRFFFPDQRNVLLFNWMSGWD